MKKLIFLFFGLLLPFLGIGQEARLLLPTKHSRARGSKIHSSDSSLILTYSADKTARLWTKDAKLLSVLEGHESKIFTAAFSPATETDPKGGKIIVTLTDNFIRFWETSSGKLLKTENTYQDYDNMALSHDGSKLALYDWGGITLYDYNTGEKLNNFQGYFSEGLDLAVFSDDCSKLLVIYNNKDFELYGYKDENISGTLEDFLKSDFFKNNFSALSKEIKGLEIKEKTFRYSDELGRADVFYNAKVNYIDRYSESEINDMFVSMDSREFIFSDISPDAKIVASISYNNEILLWELHTAKPIKFLFRHSSRIQKLKFSYDGKLLLTASEDNTIRIIDVNTGKLVKEHKIAIDNPENTREYGFREAIFSPDSKSVLFVTTGYDIGICEIESGNVKQLFKEKKLYRALFSKDGKKLILELWGPKKNTTYDDGRFITIFDQGKYRILDVSSGAEIKASRDKIKWVLPPYENNDNLVSINGFFANKFVLDYFLGNKFIVYNSTKKTFKEYQSGVQYAAVFSPPTEKDPNGAKYILSNGLDGRSIVWETDSGRALYTRFQLKNGDWLVYDEHYRYDGSPGAIDLLYFTCGMEIVELSKAKNGLHVPNLVQKIMNGENLEHLPKLKDLKICEE